MAAFESIFRLYYERLCVFAERYVQSPDQTKDLVQDVFVEGWRNRAACQGCENLRGYLYTAVRNRALKAIRHRRVVMETAARFRSKGRSPAFAAPVATPEEHTSVNELASAVERIIAGLPERSRQAYLLNRHQGMTYAEIAEAMGVSVRTVENHLARAVRGLREGLSAWIV